MVVTEVVMPALIMVMSVTLSAPEKAFLLMDTSL